MNIKQEIAELKAKLAELEAKANEPLDCYFGEGYFIDGNGTINQCLETCSINDYTQIRHKEVAEQFVPYLQIFRALRNFKCEHDPVFDLRNYTTAFGILSINEDCSLCVGKILGSIPFSTAELAQSASDMLKRRKLLCKSV